MTYYCKLCDKTIILKSKQKHFKSKTHKSLEAFTFLKYIAENPDITQLIEIMKKNVSTYIKSTNFIKFVVC